MFLALESSRGINSIAQFLTVLLIFIGVLALTYFTTRWIASYQKGKMLSGNIHVLETFKITQNKYVQIIRVGEHYYAIAIGKDTVTLLLPMYNLLNYYESNGIKIATPFLRQLDEVLGATRKEEKKMENRHYNPKYYDTLPIKEEKEEEK